MWTNWNPFRRRAEENTNYSISQNEGLDGKENTADISARVLAVLPDSRDDSGNVNENGVNNSRTNRDSILYNYGSRQANGHGNVEDNNSLESSQDDDCFCDLSGVNTNRLSPRKLSTVRQDGHQSTTPQVISSLRRSATTSPFTRSERVNLPQDSSMKMKNENMNKSFSGVHGPLLSTPIVSKVRRALESSSGLRSPQTSMLLRGKQVGRSASLNYGSGNPTKSTAGQVPWVRLKRRESLTLSDIVSGNTPQSPNTVKLATPEPRFLPAAPSFRTTPVIVTTEHSRASLVDTQTVVSALREKRKRYGASQREETLSEDSWINAAKRRRQDSSQSNASSVSIPSMPESLPNLMGTPGVSLLHIENLKNQRPSTVPAMDAFVSRHQREFGLGGDLLGHRPQQVHGHQLLQEQDVTNKQNTKSILRSIQSSLSSSLRARTNLSVLQQSGLDLNRIRKMSESHDASRKIIASSDAASMLDKSTEEPLSKVARQTPTTSLLTASPPPTDKSLPVYLSDKNAGSVSAQTKQKIADGVVLRKHNLSVTSSINLGRPKQVMPLNALVSTSDFEQDRQKEYKRRVLDLLDEDEGIDRSDVLGLTAASTTTAAIASSAPMTISVPPPVISTGSAFSIEASLAATSAAVSASLDSLNKLVQSAAGVMPSTSAGGVTSVTLSQLLKSSTDMTSQPEHVPKIVDISISSLTFPGTSVTSTVSAPSFAMSKENTFEPIISSTPSTQKASTELSLSQTVVSATGGFKFGASVPTATRAALPQTTALTMSGGFHTAFFTPGPSGAHPSIGTYSVAPPASVVSTGSSQKSVSSGFNFSSGAVSSPLPNTSVFISGGSAFSGMVQTTPSAVPGFGITDGSLSNSTSQHPDNILASMATSTPYSMTSDRIDPSQGGSKMFGSVVPQGAASSPGSFSLSSTLQAFAAAQSGDGNSFNRQVAGSAQGHSFMSSAAVTTATASVLPVFSFGPSNSTASLPAGFGFNSTGASTIQASNFAPASTALAPSNGNPTAAKVAFNFGPTSSAATSSQHLGGLSFGAVPTNTVASPAPAVGWAAPSMTGTGGFTGQSANSAAAKGFGSNTHSTASMAFSPDRMQPPNMFTVVTTTASIPSLFVPGAASFGTNSQTPQFGSTTSTATFQMFGTTAATTSTGAFAFGQSTASSVPSKAFTFGAVSNQPGAANSFVGVSGGAVTTSHSIFGNVAGPSPSAGVASIFGNGSTSAFGNNLVNSQFGSSVPVTSPPAFGSTVTSPPAFGSSVTSQPAFGSSVASQPAFGSSVASQPAFGSSVASQTAFGSSVASQPAFGSSVASQPAFGSSVASQPAFGSSVASQPAFGSSVASQPAFGSSVASQPAFGSTVTSPPPFGSTVTSPPPFGSAVTSPVFGATSSQTAVFGAAALQGGQSSSVFGAPVSSANQLFTFGSGAGSGQQSVPQHAPAFGSNPGTSFGNVPAAAGSSVFGAKPAAPTFSAATANPAFMFGAPTQTSSTATSQPFGSSFGMSAAFATQQNAEKPPFGATSTGFGNPAMPAFGSTTQSSVFGAASQNAPQNMFGPTSQNPPPPAFGSQQGSLQQASSSAPFGGAGPSSANFFGATKSNMFGATTTTQPSLNFGTTQPSQFNAQTVNTGFNFAAQAGAQPTVSAGMGLNFGAQTPVRPGFQGQSSGFNFAPAAGSTPTFNFSGTPSTPNMFTPQTPNAVPRPRATVRRPGRRGGARR